MYAWLLFLAVLATSKHLIRVASTEDQMPVILDLYTNRNNYTSSNSEINNNNINNTNTHLTSLNNLNNLENFLNLNNSTNKLNKSSNNDEHIINKNNNININKNNNSNNNNNVNNNNNNIKNNNNNFKNTNNKNNDKNNIYIHIEEDNKLNNFKDNSNNNINDKEKPDPETLVQIESSLLSLFGLKKPPKIDRSKIIIPEAMKKLYSQIMGHEYDSVTIPRPGFHTQTANTVRSFTHEDSKIDDRFKHHHKFRLFFNINSIPNDEKLKAAELTINRDIIEDPSITNLRYRVLVYDILKLGIKGKLEPSYLLLDTKTIYLNSSESLSFDVQPAVNRWMLEPKQNYGLLIEVRTAKKLKPAQHNHVRLRRSTHEAHHEWAPKQPLLLTYTDDGRHKPRSLREGTRQKRAHHRGHRRKNGRDNCQRKPLYVDFSDVGWSDWIVAPPGYEAFFCQGDCPFPLGEHLNSTNHAAVQTLVHNINPAKVPKPCCVPTQLTAISMLYLNDQSTVVLKNYQDMAVVGCGCR